MDISITLLSLVVDVPETIKRPAVPLSSWECASIVARQDCTLANYVLSVNMSLTVLYVEEMGMLRRIVP